MTPPPGQVRGGVKVGVQVGVKVWEGSRSGGQGHWVKVRVGGHKVGGQGRSSRSWGQVGGGFEVGGPGRGLRSGEGSRFGVKVGVMVVVKVVGQG